MMYLSVKRILPLFVAALAAVFATPAPPSDLPADLVNPIDALVDAYFRRNSVSVQAVVSDAVFARRVYLDVWGLLPTPEQLRTFSREPRQDKRIRLVDDLLANRKNYSEHWISYWNDLLRNDEGVNYAGARQSISEWLLKALEENLPYDQFVSALLNPKTAQDPAGYLIGVNWRGEVSASQSPPMQAAQNSSQVFLGVNLKCNSCHDSFISRWKLKDAYGMASFFSEEELELYRCDVKTGDKSSPRFLFPNLGSVEAAAPLPERRAAAARLFTSAENGRFAQTIVNRIWAKLFGRGLVESVDDMDEKAWSPELLDLLASDFISHGYDLKFLLRRVLTSRAYQVPAAASTSSPGGKFVFRGPLMRRLTAEQFVDGVSSVTGEWRSLVSRNAGAGTYSRDWRLKSSALTRAMGRPIRDQVYTQRNTDATTLQALELVNGATMASLVEQGARRMMGQLQPAPQNVFDSGVVSGAGVPVDIDISGAKRLWLLLEDADSYDRNRVVAGWAAAELAGPHGTAMLKDLPASPAPQKRLLRFKGKRYEDGLGVPLSSQVVYDIAGRGFSRLRAVVGVDESSVQNDISPRVRFFVFTEQPDRNRLINVTGEPPVPAPPEKLAPENLVERVYGHALGRVPDEGERSLALGLLKRNSPEGLADLLWCVFLSPEFQYIR